MTWLPILVLLNVVGGLSLEAVGAARGWSWAESFVAFVTCAHLAFYFFRPPRFGHVRVTRKMLWVCLALSTFGELVLSMAWGLYTYRQSLLPLFVPPGHVLLFLSGLALSHQIDSNNRWIWTVPAFGLGAALWSYLSHGNDVLSLALLALFVLSFAFKRHRPLYAIMFALALLLELLGTYVGAWKWAMEVPHLMIASANPPIAAGALYAILDLLTLALCGGWVLQEKLSPEPSPGDSFAVPKAEDSDSDSDFDSKSG